MTQIRISVNRLMAKNLIFSFAQKSCRFVPLWQTPDTHLGMACGMQALPGIMHECLVPAIFRDTHRVILRFDPSPA
jgi:hypothetical protein